jgi:hypothetical protein
MLAPPWLTMPQEKERTTTDTANSFEKFVMCLLPPDLTTPFAISSGHFFFRRQRTHLVNFGVRCGS